MMQDTMGVFEDRGGAVRSVKIESPETSIVKPSDFLAVSGVNDAFGIYVDHALTSADIEISGAVINYPVTVNYLVKFRDFSFDKDLPDESVGLILKHFAATLAVRNTRRERAVAVAAGLQAELPSEETLTARVDAIELAIEEAALIIPMVTVV
jgi:hypothetical protein